MNRNDRRNNGLMWVVPLMVAGLACAMPGQSSGGGAATEVGSGGGVSTPEVSGGQPTATTPVEAGTAGEGEPVDLCALATPEEVQAVLGGPAVRAVWYDYGQNCALFLDDTHFLIVQAGHEPDGKALHLAGAEGQRSKITDPAALAVLDQVAAQKDSLTMLELVRQLLPVWRAAGFSANEETGIGDWAFSYFGYGMPTQTMQLAELGAGRAVGKWVGVYVTASDEAAGLALLRPLAAALLDRLPDNFTPTGNGF